MNFGAMMEMSTRFGVKLRRWPDSTLRIMEQAWTEVVEEESARNPLFKKVADHFYEFRKKYKVWKDAQQMKSTYLKY